MNPRRGRTGEAAFTLLELIVVITIIGILGTFVAVRVAPMVGNAQRTKTEHDLREIVKAAKLLQVTKGSLPESLDDLVRPLDADGKLLGGGFDALPLDAWNHPYHYEVRDGEPIAFTLGKDDGEGGDGENADVYFPKRES